MLVWYSCSWIVLCRLACSCNCIGIGMDIKCKINLLSYIFSEDSLMSELVFHSRALIHFFPKLSCSLHLSVCLSSSRFLSTCICSAHLGPLSHLLSRTSFHYFNIFHTQYQKCAINLSVWIRNGCAEYAPRYNRKNPCTGIPIHPPFPFILLFFRVFVFLDFLASPSLSSSYSFSFHRQPYLWP